uniref:tRNA pseudouridine(55) synthase n=1 Tax=Ascaris lumbricoides TaxID=6252 RepID=A0A0M3HXN1_ASCLU
MVQEIAKDNFDKNPYDSTNFVLALNMPVTTILREAILGCTNETTFANGTLTSVPFKLRVVQSYIDKIQAVCEKIASPFIRVAKCDSTRFIASGREDIDVRMLGSGRPFALQLINPHLTAPFGGEQLGESLKKIAEEINSQCDIRLGAPLRRISMKETESLKVRQDEKRKSYTAYCYSTQSLDEKLLDELSSKAPIEISQKTPVRVLKRRPLLDRKRTIFALQALKLDEFHFLIR